MGNILLYEENEASPFAFLQSGVLTAFCPLRSCVSIYESILHSLMIKHSCGIYQKHDLLALQLIYTMHNKFSNFLYFASFLCSSLCNADQFQLQCLEQDLRQMKPQNFRRNPLNRHLGRARIAEGVSKQKSHPL